MQTTTRIATAGWVALMLGITLGAADDETRTVQADGLSFSVPKAWKSERPTSPMRKSQIKVEPVAGDTEPAEMYLVILSNKGGGLDANVARWEGQFSGENGKPAKAKVETKKGKNIEVTRVEIAGKFAGMGMPGQPKQEAKPNTKLLGAIVMSSAGDGYFLKLTGPEKTVAALTKQFDQMIASMTIDQ